MKDILRQRFVYYIAVPVLLALWPLLMWKVYLPRLQERIETEAKNYETAEQYMEKILQLDDGRLKFKDATKKVEFDYAVAVDTAARKRGIGDAGYTVSAKPIRRSDGRKTRDCQVTLVEIDIEKFSRFLSDLQLTWANLQCHKATLTKKQGLPDAWKVDLSFKYYY